MNTATQHTARRPVACACNDTTGAACPPAPRTSSDAVTYQPPMDVCQFADRFDVVMDLPGAVAEQIEVSVDEGVLTVHARVPARVPARVTPLHGEFGVGDFFRRVRIGEDIDAEGMTARFHDGVLTVSLPTRPERQPRRVRVTAG